LSWSVTAARADRESIIPAQLSVAVQTSFVILFMGVPFQMRPCRELRTDTRCKRGFARLALHRSRTFMLGVEL